MLLRLDWCYSSLYEDAYPILLLVLLMLILILLKKANGYLAAYWLLQKAKAWQQLDKMLMTAYSQIGKKLTVVIWLRDCSFVVCLNESIQPSGPWCLWQFVPLTMFHGTLCVIATANNNKSTNRVNFKKQITWNHCRNLQSKKETSQLNLSDQIKFSRARDLRAKWTSPDCRSTTINCWPTTTRCQEGQKSTSWSKGSWSA